MLNPLLSVLLHGRYEYLNPECSVDKFVLHSTEFACAWNNHPLRTARNWSPKKIWTNGVLDPRNEHQTAVRDIIDPLPSEGLDSFGLDAEGALPIEGDESVEVNEVPCPIENNDQFIERFNPLQTCNDFGLALYLH